jgi:hypothetical protein
MIIYLIVGLVWVAWLEYYTTRNLEGEDGRKWNIGERIFHLVVWPFSVGTFIYHFFKAMNDDY